MFITVNVCVAVDNSEALFSTSLTLFFVLSCVHTATLSSYQPATLSTLTVMYIYI